MTGFSTPFPGSLSAGLNALSAPIGSGPPASLLAQLLKRASATNSLPGSPAPQIPTFPLRQRGALGPVPNLPSPAQPPQNNLSSLLGGLGSLGKTADGGAASPLASANAPWSWQASTGLFGGNGPLFGVGNIFGPGGMFGSTAPAWGTTDPWSALSASQLGALGAGAGTGAASLGYGSLLGGSAATAAALPEGMSLADMLGAGLIAM